MINKTYRKSHTHFSLHTMRHEIFFGVLFGDFFAIWGNWFCNSQKKVCSYLYDGDRSIFFIDKFMNQSTENIFGDNFFCPSWKNPQKSQQLESTKMSWHTVATSCFLIVLETHSFVSLKSHLSLWNRSE